MIHTNGNGKAEVGSKIMQGTWIWSTLRALVNEKNLSVVGERG